MIKTQLWHRVSFNYADGWKHLDEEIPLGEFTLTPAVITHQCPDPLDGYTYVQYATVPVELPSDTVIAALHNTMGGTNCRHEHDCCGCAIRSTFVKQKGPRIYMVRTTVRYNI